MGIVIRQGFKGTIVAYLGVLIGAFNLLYLFPKLLSPEEIGLTKVLLELSLLLSGIAQIGTSGIIDRFFPMFKDEDKKHNGFFVLVLFYPIIGFLVLCVAFLLAKEFWLFLYESKSPLLVNYYYYLIPFTFFCIYHAVLESYIRAQYRIVVPLVIKEIFLRVFFSAVTILYYFDIISLEIFISLIIFSYALAVFTLVFYLKLLHKLYLNGFSIKNNKISIRQMGKFSLIAISSGTLGLIASKIDVILISSNIGLKTTAVYAIAFYIATVIEIPRRSISLICIPIVASFWKNNNLPGIKDLYARVALNQLIIGLFIFLLIWCNVDFILKIIPNGHIYQAGKYVILIIGLARLFDMLTGINTEIINTSAFFKINFPLTIISAIFTITTSRFLIPQFGMEGAAISTLIGYSLFNFIKIYFIWYKVSIQPFTFQTLQILFLGILVYFASFILRKYISLNNDFLLFILNSLLIATVFLIPIYRFNLSIDIKSAIDKALRLQ